MELRREAAQQVTLRTKAEERALEAEQTTAGLQVSLEKERTMRKAAERALRVAENARDAAEQLIRELSKAPPVQRGRVSKTAMQPEPEPIKWWLAPAPTGTRSRRH